MDYMTQPLSRENIRYLSQRLRLFFDIPLEGSFPVLSVLDKLSYLLNTSYEIVDDDALPPNTMALCFEIAYEKYVVQIKESVYDNAYNGDGASLGFICHEICHIFLFYIGQKPVFETSFADGEISPCRSVEWQAKALCGEVMIPFNQSRNMSEEQIIQKFNVSRGFAQYRLKLEQNNFVLRDSITTSSGSQEPINKRSFTSV